MRFLLRIIWRIRPGRIRSVVRRRNSPSRFDSSAYLLRYVGCHRHPTPYLPIRQVSLLCVLILVRTFVLLVLRALFDLSLFVVFFVGLVFVLSDPLVVAIVDNVD